MVELDLAASREHDGSKPVGHRLRATFDHRPTDGVERGQQRERHARCQRTVGRHGGVGGEPGEQGTSLGRAKTASQHGGRQQGERPEAGGEQRVPGLARDGPERGVGERVDVLDERREQPSVAGPVDAEPCRRLLQ